MQSEVNQEENLNRIITVPNLLSFFRLCLILVIIWSYIVTFLLYGTAAEQRQKRFSIAWA